MELKKDYSLIGPSRAKAINSGLVNADWYKTPIKREMLKKVMKRSDLKPIIDTIIWFVLILISGLGIIYTWGSWLVVPFLIVYGVMYGSAGDSRWHECGHGTAFKTVWLNKFVYQVSSFMMVHPPTVWYWSHIRHHTDTIIIGRDRENVLKRPPEIFILICDIFGLISVSTEFKNIFLHAFGHLGNEEKDFVPENEHHKVILEARIWLIIYFTIIIFSIIIESIIPLVLIPGGRLYGVWHLWFCGLFQHGGLAEDQLDHRLNTRTAYLNPISRFIYWNMNYHIEHHMYPLVPYYNLPELHKLIKHDCPKPNNGFFGAWKEMLPIIIKQIKDPTVFLLRDLPSSANPYFSKSIYTMNYINK